MCASDLRQLRVVTAMNEMNDTPQHGLQAAAAAVIVLLLHMGKEKEENEEEEEEEEEKRHESTLSFRFFLGSVSWLLDPSSRQLGGL
jgi:2',3'-cyclic-nucleotide 2'-phosphodiesterase (5'-nucleotidase family)